MPELPEVEVVRRGLTALVLGKRVSEVEVRHPRAVRRHLGGPADLVARLRGRTFTAVGRRGKYLWVELDDGDSALLGHLGMSGQLLVRPPGAPEETHLRVRIRFVDEPSELRFVDQRTFGGLSVERLEPVGGELLPRPVVHIARDPMDPAFQADEVVDALRRRRTGLKRALLDQTLVSGIGNIYADEALWLAHLHPARPTGRLTRAQGQLAAGGTSFDALYVNVNGQSGYFDRSLAVYGQADRPCPRCGTPIRREPFMNRSSYYCPRCQPRPRRPHP
jgi:formamidopyrimidine-DNA glycosylase